MKRILLLVCLAAAIPTAPSASAHHSIAKTVSCRHVLHFKGHWYDALPGPRRSKPGRLLRHRAQVTCESFVRCKRGAECVEVPQRVLGTTVVRRVRGAGRAAKELLIDTRTGRLYLRERPEGPGGGTVPPPADVVTASGGAPLSTQSFCWTEATKDGFVSMCADVVAPWLQAGVPLVAAQKGAQLTFSLGFQPSSVHIVLGGRQGDYVDQQLDPAKPLIWRVPKNVPRKSYLLVEATRLYEGKFNDSVAYLTRLRIVT